jgi:hypothetical protein
MIINLHLYDMCILNHIHAQYWYRPQKSNIAWKYYMWYALFAYCNVPKYNNNICPFRCDHEGLMSTLILYFKIITSLIFSWSEIEWNAYFLYNMICRVVHWWQCCGMFISNLSLDKRGARMEGDMHGLEWEKVVSCFQLVLDWDSQHEL